MYTTVGNDGLMNNYAVEPKMYYAEFPSEWQQKQYLFQGTIAFGFIALTILTALSVS